MTKKTSSRAKVSSLTHSNATRRNIPTAEHDSVTVREDHTPIRVAVERRNRDLDPQLVWRGKGQQDTTNLVVLTPPIYIQEKIHPKLLIDDLLRESRGDKHGTLVMSDLLADFNGTENGNKPTRFYQHDSKWTNRMILGDSLQVMSALAEREGLRGKVQCIYIDPPYGIKFNSNFQWSTTSHDVRDGSSKHITREPEQIKAFRDTWRDGVHTYLAYLRDRLLIGHSLLHESGSCFLQISEENVHLVRVLLDEVFGSKNFISMITYKTTGGTSQLNSPRRISDYILWYAKDAARMKFRRLFKDEIDTDSFNKVEDTKNGTRRSMTPGEKKNPDKLGSHLRPFRTLPLHSKGDGDSAPREFRGKKWTIPGGNHWRHKFEGFERLCHANRIVIGKKVIRSVDFFDDFGYTEYTNNWDDTGPELKKTYVVQTSTKVIQRCMLMCSDPGDLVLDPTCGSGTTAFVAEQWGRRWITIDTSRVALALTRARIMGARYPWYFLRDTEAGVRKEAELKLSVASATDLSRVKKTHHKPDIRQGFVYERVPRITLKSISDNSEISLIREKWNKVTEPLRKILNSKINAHWEDWNMPRDAGDGWHPEMVEAHAQWLNASIACQEEIQASVAANAEREILYDKPCPDNSLDRVAGPFTVESLAPHRMLAVDENDDVFDPQADKDCDGNEASNFTKMILDSLRTSGVQQTEKENRISFSSLMPWPGRHVCAEGNYEETTKRRVAVYRAGIFIGPEFGTVSRPDLAAAAREAAEGGFDVLIACAFNYDARSSELVSLGRIPILKARMNPDLHMAKDLKNTGKGNLFVVFGEPEIDIIEAGNENIIVHVKGVVVFHPNTNEMRSSDADSIACWFIDTDYDEESFFVRHAYFLGSEVPFKALKKTLRAEINEEALAACHSDISRPFPKPTSGRIAIKVINVLGDEAMKVYRVE